VRQDSDLSASFSQAPPVDPVEHEGEGLPLGLHPGMTPGQGERFPRVTWILDPEGTALLDLDNETLGALLRLTASQASQEPLGWNEAVAWASSASVDPVASERSLRRVLRAAAR
jgi:hypothetical protein